jgi:thioredoxin domain-containing protein 5
MNAPHKPLVVLVAVGAEGKDQYTKQIKDIAKAWQEKELQSTTPTSRGVAFTWMDADRWASWLKSMYGIQVVNGAEPQVVIASHAVRRYGFLICFWLRTMRRI